MPSHVQRCDDCPWKGRDSRKISTTADSSRTFLQPFRRRHASPHCGPHLVLRQRSTARGVPSRRSPATRSAAAPCSSPGGRTSRPCQPCPPRTTASRPRCPGSCDVAGVVVDRGFSDFRHFDRVFLHRSSARPRRSAISRRAFSAGLVRPSRMSSIPRSIISSVAALRGFSSCSRLL
jgi:hypothetical protein